MNDVRDAARAGAIQDVPTTSPASAEAVTAAIQILSEDRTIADAVVRVGEYFSGRTGTGSLDGVAVSLISTRPENTDGWLPLGERAWLWMWIRPGADCSIVPILPDGSPQVLTLPFVSPIARQDVAAVADAHLLPDTDRAELAACGVRRVLTKSIVYDGVLLGSLAIGRRDPGRWSDEQVADVRLLSSALGSRMGQARNAQALADAIERGEQARATHHQFFASAGHELRTPIAAILGSAEVLADDAEQTRASVQDEKAETFAQGVAQDAKVILSAGEQLLAIVEDLLSTGHELRAGTERTWVDVAEALADVVHWLRTAARTAEVRVVTEVPTGVRVCTTPTALRQILTNLVGNAINYHHPGGYVRVSSSRALDEFGEPRVRIRVRDDGRGLTPEQQREVFKPFVRFATDVKGTGLGLSLSRTLAERDGGLMGVESVPGEGSSFWVDLPAAPVDPPADG